MIGPIPKLGKVFVHVLAELWSTLNLKDHPKPEGPEAFLENCKVRKY